jgi:hypothetical protein
MPTTQDHVHGKGCGCLAALSRRGFLGMGAGMAGLAAMGGFAPVLAQAKKYDFMLVSCIDPRLVSEVHEYMAGQGWRGKYSQFVIAGGPVAVIAPKFERWRNAVWDNIAATIELHGIARVYGMTHRDCGAFKIAYGDAVLSTPDKEQRLHEEVLRAFRQRVLRRHPRLGVDTGIMALNGSVQIIPA